jgi:hypothetical protein
MRKIQGVVFILVLVGGVIMSGCDTKSSSNNSALLMLLLMTNQGTISFNDGTAVSMTSPSGFEPGLGTGYLGAFQKDVNNWILISVPSTQPMTAPQSFTQATPSFSFGYAKNGTSYNVGGSSFTFTISSVSGGKASGTFSGTLVPVSGPSLIISGGTFSGVVIH